MVLCLTHSKDFYTIDIVQRTLERSGVPSFRFNTDEFGISYQLNYSLQNGEPHIQLATNGRKISAADITGVWYRKLWKLQLPNELDTAWQEVYTKEYQTYQQIFFNSIRHVPWMNDLKADHTAGNDKLLQLIAAKDAGLTVPRTIFTNDASTINDFFDQCNGNLVVKLHGALSKSMEGNTPFFPTTKLSAGDLERLDDLAYCPMIFQEYIPKAYELRVVYADGEFFSGKIPAGSTDWRTTKGGPIQWEHYELPQDACSKITAMMKSLNLLFGAIDIIRNTDGEYVFLEVNPQGEWGMLQKYLEYPIGETIAHKLITRIKNG